MLVALGFCREEKTGAKTIEDIIETQDLTDIRV